MANKNKLTPEIAKEFLRVCRQADPTGQYSALYRQNKLLDELWQEAVKVAGESVPQNKANLRSKTILSS